MQSIKTRFIPATNTKGSRIKARTSSGLSVTLQWDDALDSATNHDAAARTLIVRLKWDDRGVWHSGGLRGGGNVYVCAQTDPYYSTALEMPTQKGGKS